MKRAVRVVILGLGLGLGLLGLGGCGTTMSAGGGVLFPFSGVEMDTWIIRETPSSWERVARVADIPLSLVADAALLPLTIPIDLQHDY